jgi:hypothetical protein
MITGEACFAAWAPEGDFWSRWAKPVVFASAGAFIDEPVTLPSLDELPVPGSFDPSAIVVDLPGEESVLMGLALAGRGYRPVPLFNGTWGPNAVVPVDRIARALGGGVAILSKHTLPAGARPAFLLDAGRGDTRGSGEPGRYDNRWIVLPQDFPSAATLLSKGITGVTLVRRANPLPDQDLAIVLRRWQDAGIRMRCVTTDTNAAHENLSLVVPTGVRWLWYGALALMGLRRSNVGGFGAQIPEQTARGSGFYG